MNKGANYAIKRGTDRKIDLHEAKAILRKAEESGRYGDGYLQLLRLLLRCPVL
ncbi:MAG: hypothetical protein JW943_01015 [Deltaproteobacteria bacterium]|nr:hypothetical protein [Deltaproteobacteria bacterium]